MDFKGEIKRFAPEDIMRVVGCPRRTAFSWVMGERLPPVWVQRLVLRALARTAQRRRSQKGQSAQLTKTKVTE
jgi:hypothetical protein